MSRLTADTLATGSSIAPAPEGPHRPADRVAPPASPVGLEREPLRSADYIAEIVDIPQKTVLQYARDGRLPCVRIGKHVRFRVSEVDAALTTGR
jgi:excisionase family DNA binding protein